MRHTLCPLHKLAKKFGQESAQWFFNCSATSRMKTSSETTRVGHFRRAIFREKCCLLGSSLTFGGPVRKATVKTRKGVLRNLLESFQRLCQQWETERTDVWARIGDANVAWGQGLTFPRNSEVKEGLPYGGKALQLPLCWDQRFLGQGIHEWFKASYGSYAKKRPTWGSPGSGLAKLPRRPR